MRFLFIQQLNPQSSSICLNIILHFCRIIIANLEQNTWKVLKEGLFLPWGLAPHPDGKSFLATEYGTGHIWRIPLDGKAASVFTTIPGFPMGLRRTLAKDGYWVAVPATRHSEGSTLFDNLATRPKLRKVAFAVSSQ